MNHGEKEAEERDLVLPGVRSKFALKFRVHDSTESRQQRLSEKIQDGAELKTGSWWLCVWGRQ